MNPFRLSPAAWASLKSLAIQFVGALLTVLTDFVTRWLTDNQTSLGVFAAAVLFFWTGLAGQINAWVKSWTPAPTLPQPQIDPATVVLPGESEDDAT